MKKKTLADLLEQYRNQEKMWHWEGGNGVRNFCRLVRALGYKDRQYFGQFAHDGCYGDLLRFLEDNPGCLETMFEWIAESNVPEWKNELEAVLMDQPDEEQEEE